MTRLTRVTPPRVRRAARPAPPAPRRAKPKKLRSLLTRVYVEREACALRFIRLFFNLGKVVSSRRIIYYISYLEGVVSCARRSSCRFTDSQHPRRARMDYGHMHTGTHNAHTHTQTRPLMGTHARTSAYKLTHLVTLALRSRAVPLYPRWETPRPTQPCGVESTRAAITMAGTSDGAPEYSGAHALPFLRLAMSPLLHLELLPVSAPYPPLVPSPSTVPGPTGSRL